MAPTAQSINPWYDPREGTPAFQIEAWSPGNNLWQPERTNCFTVIWVTDGSGYVAADAARHAFLSPCLLFFKPYQYLRVEPDAAVSGSVIRFHANFLCVETFHAEVGCSGVLFNDLYNPPIVTVNLAAKKEVITLLSWMNREQTRQLHAYQEAALAALKLLLIQATRWKTSDVGRAPECSAAVQHSLLPKLQIAIEKHYQSLHTPADYARLLHTTPKTLGRIVKEHLGKTLTELIRDRVLTHAKWQLLHSLKPVKEIAREIGFQDELYFSRLFKKATGLSPIYFREFETEIRGGSNLSMLSSAAPIQTDHHSAR